jgi:CDP-glucose 4,6-dehydratase
LEGVVDRTFWKGKKIIVTGHTGFKGAWLSLWLIHLGAKVRGISLPPNTVPSLFHQLGLVDLLDHQVSDVRDRDLMHFLIRDWQPDVVFHLAAQPLVRRSYSEPVETWNINVMGTIHILEALKDLSHSCAAVFITTDKCYENREWFYGYREDDALGGYDPYSSSKAAAELAIASWRSSFFNGRDIPIGIASVRAGNVIGGGDWAEDRIVPDAMRSLIRREAILVRNPCATRPWQHVLEPLGGYLLLAQRLYENKQKFCTSFNFGPKLDSSRPVRELVECILQHWSGSWIDLKSSNTVHEAQRLHLVTEKAFHLLEWSPVWDFERTIKETVFWYREASQILGDSITQFQELTLKQIDCYVSDISITQIKKTPDPQIYPLES